MPPLISVIVPAFNTAQRLKFSLNSIAVQDYVNLEIIFVDDASTDDTGIIAREILSSSARPFTLITNSTNSGASSSRNTALASAKGEYVCFVDADDSVRPSFISSLYDSAVKNDSDIAFCGRTDTFSDGSPDINITHKNFNAERLIMNNSVPSFFCCLYRMSLLRKYNLLFHNGCTCGEDTEFITKALCRAGKISSVNQCLYFYAHHNAMGSVRDNNTPQKIIRRYSDNTEAIKRTAEYISANSTSRTLRKFSRHVLMPQYIIRRFNLCAMKNDMQVYMSTLKDGNARKILRQAVSFYTLVKKSEVFFKALMILKLPMIYYRLRTGKNYDG